MNRLLARPLLGDRFHSNAEIAKASNAEIAEAQRTAEKGREYTSLRIPFKWRAESDDSRPCVITCLTPIR